MKLERLRIMREGQRRAISSRFEEIEAAKGESVKFDTLLKNIEGKVDAIKSLSEQIVEMRDVSDLEEEIAATDEYMVQIEIRFNEYKAYCNTDANAVKESSVNQNADITVDSEIQFSAHAMANAQYDDMADSGMSRKTEYEYNNVTQTSSNTCNTFTQFHKLPKLTLPTFSGTLLDWQTFWDSYNAAVHSNPTLSDIQKFTYLKSQLEGDAARSISRFTMTNANYQQAVDLFRERFGQVHKITNAYMQALLQLPTPYNNLNSLRDFYDKLEAYVRGLESLGEKQENYGSMLVPVIIGKLPPEMRKSLARENGSDKWVLSELRSAIKRELNILEAGQGVADVPEVHYSTASFFTGMITKDSDNPIRKSRTEIHGNQQNWTETQRSNGQRQPKTCVFCNGYHSSHECNQVRDYNKRIQIVRKNRLCFNCLGKHQVSACTSNFKCRICRRKHHTSICTGNALPSQSHITPLSQEQFTGQQEPHSSVLLTNTFEQTPTPLSREQFNGQQQPHSSVLLTNTFEPTPGVLLKTAIAPICTDTTSVDANILFDEGAQRSFITEKLANQLNVTRTGSDIINIAAFGYSTQSVHHVETAQVYLKTDSDERIPMHVLIVPTIAVPLNTRINKKATKLPYLENLKLAHPVTTDDMFEIAILIGADYYWQIVQNRIVRGDGPTAMSSKIGYLLSGPLPNAETRHWNHVMNVVTTPISYNLERFWNLESLGIDNKDFDSDHALELYKQRQITFEGGRYVARLPWKPDHAPLPSNYEITKKRTENTIRRLSQQPALLKKYGEIIAEQENRGFIERIPEQERLVYVHYIPHHAVRKESDTTPIRIVYDCSCKQSKETPSLNECLQSTPPELNGLTNILIRFRQYRFGVVTDIEKAFLNVGLHENDRDFTRFLWLSDPEDPSSALQTYRFRAILFGATCSPFILNAAIQKHLDENSRNLVSERLKKDLYVDNILSSFPQEETVLRYFKDTRNLMSSAAFNLRSWTSNSKYLRHAAAELGILDTNTIAKVLGMRWNVISDELLFAERPLAVCEKSTKREILKQTSRIYDPLGILSPITVRAKILLQEIWRRKLNWDTPLPSDLHEKWRLLATDLNLACKTKVQRHYFENGTSVENAYDQTTLHVFVDASMSAYSATAYICSGNQATLVMAKNRVAPLKKITLPRLELLAAVIGARMATTIQQTLSCRETVFWSDSQIVLHWIASTKTLDRFVQNRVHEIHNLTKSSKWRYCSTRDNPADLHTRGISNAEFQDNTIWMTGPTWLPDSSNWPSWDYGNNVTMVTAAVEQQQQTETLDFTNEKPGIHYVIDINSFSKYKRLIRVTALVGRFIENCKLQREKRHLGPLTVDELVNAEQRWLQSCQTTNFQAEINELTNQSGAKNKTTLVRQLRLFIDRKKIARCRGRIHNAPLDDMTKYPILLPTKHTLTTLIVQDAHEKTLHSGENATVTQIRQKFWLPRIRQVVKSILRKCVTCKKVTGRPYAAPETPPLVKYRVEDTPPFTVTGVDFTGALYVKDKTGCNTKAYICLFTCAATRAIHLEVVLDLTEGSFLQAFRRFTARKSLPRLMISDNAMTFQAASNHLRHLTSSKSLQDSLSTQGTQWQFIPKRAPWFGGWWERLIGLTKTTLKKVLGRSYITCEELQTIVIEIEAVLNNRPLTYVTSNACEPEPLTPSQLLYGRNITSFPYDYIPVPDVTMETNRATLVKRIRKQFKLIDNFHNRWKREYLTSLREHEQVKGNKNQKKTIVVGEVVQIYDDKPRVQWQLGIVEAVVKGNDGQIRSVRLRTKNGTTNRPVTKLYPLEINAEGASC